MTHWSIFFKCSCSTDSMMTIRNVKIRNISHMLFVSVMPSIEPASTHPLNRLSVGRLRQYKANSKSSQTRTKKPQRLQDLKKTESRITMLIKVPHMKAFRCKTLLLQNRKPQILVSLLRKTLLLKKMEKTAKCPEVLQIETSNCFLLVFTCLY